MPGPAIIPPYLSIDHSYRMRAANQFLTVVDGWKAYWGAATPGPQTRLAGTIGEMYPSFTTVPLNALAQYVNGLADDLSLFPGNRLPIYGHIGYHQYQSVLNNIMVFFNAMTAARP